MVALEGAWPPRAVPIASDIDFEQGIGLMSQGASSVRLAVNEAPAHVVLIRSNGRTELRVYDPPQLESTGRAWTKWRSLLQLGIPGESDRTLIPRDLDGDGDEELVIGPVKDRGRTFFLILGLEEPE